MLGKSEYAFTSLFKPTPTLTIEYRLISIGRRAAIGVGCHETLALISLPNWWQKSQMEGKVQVQLLDNENLLGSQIDGVWVGQRGLMSSFVPGNGRSVIVQ